MKKIKEKKKRKYNSTYYQRHRNEILSKLKSPEARKKKREFYQRNREKILKRQKELNQTPKYQKRIKAYTKKYRKEHLDKIKSYDKIYKEKNRKVLNEYQREYIKKNREEVNRRAKENARRVRLKAIEKLGGKCVYCSCSVVNALEINHINGGGRKEYLKKGARKIYSEIVKGTYFKSVEVTCRVCNAVHYLKLKRGIEGFKVIWNEKNF